MTAEKSAPSSAAIARATRRGSDPAPEGVGSLPADHAGEIRPLVVAGRAVVVDHHPICAVCGDAVEPIGPAGWRHARRGAAARSPWLAPLTLDELRALDTYEAFRARAACAVRADVGLDVTTSEAEWREGRRRLDEYVARLASVRRQAALSAGANPYLDLVRILTAPPLTVGLAQMLNLAARRRELAALFSWAIPTEAALGMLAKCAPLLECGAGMGYWTALLRARGVDVVAYDVAPPGTGTANRFHVGRRKAWTSIHRGSSVAAVRRHPERTLFLCWPPYDDAAASYAALRAYRGDVFIYVGERDDGATGSVRFHRELRLNWTLIDELELPRWPRLRDSVMVYRRNPVRRVLRERDRCFECRRFIPTGAIGRCDRCVEARPVPLVLKSGRHRIEYPQEAVDAMPPALRRALEKSRRRIR